MAAVIRTVNLRVLWVAYLVFSCFTLVWMLFTVNGPVQAQPSSVNRMVEEARANERRDVQLADIRERLEKLDSINASARLERLELMVDIHSHVAEILGVPFLFLLLKEVFIYLRPRRSDKSS